MELYVHIPFCRKKCRYCSFTSYTGQEAYAETYIDLILQEAKLRKKEVFEPVHTVFLGGGTPSVLSPGLLKRLTDGLRHCFPLEPSVEFTSEANPGTLTEQWLDVAAHAGINRLSLGVQAVQPDLLRILGRIHHFDEVVRSVCLVREAGINNLNLDLIFGIPGQTFAEWKETLNGILSLSPEHISAYGLIPEESTPLYEDLKTRKVCLPEPELEREMYDFAIRKLSRNGFLQYEVSNFALPGYECRHNIGYWTQQPYIGLGASAVSMTYITEGKNGLCYHRLSNPSSLHDYEALVREGGPPSEELITPKEARFETMMLGLRMKKGVNENRFAKMHGMTLFDAFGQKLSELEKKGLLQYVDGYWQLTRRGFDIQNAVLVELMDD